MFLITILIFAVFLKNYYSLRNRKKYVYMQPLKNNEEPKVQASSVESLSQSHTRMHDQISHSAAASASPTSLPQCKVLLSSEQTKTHGNGVDASSRSKRKCACTQLRNWWRFHFDLIGSPCSTPPPPSSLTPPSLSSDSLCLLLSLHPSIAHPVPVVRLFILCDVTRNQ